MKNLLKIKLGELYENYSVFTRFQKKSFFCEKSLFFQQHQMNCMKNTVFDKFSVKAFFCEKSLVFFFFGKKIR